MSLSCGTTMGTTMRITMRTTMRTTMRNTPDGSQEVDQFCKMGSLGTEKQRKSSNQLDMQERVINLNLSLSGSVESSRRGFRSQLKGPLVLLIPVLWECRSDFVIESFSLRVIEVGRDIEKMSDGRVNMEATGSRAKEGKS